MSRQSLIDRMRGRGAGFILRRALREIYAPETGAGRLMRPLTAPAWAAFRALHGFWRGGGGVAEGWADTLVFFYDLEVAQVTFDFTFHLVEAEALRRQRGLKHLAVVFVAGRLDGLRPETRQYEAAFDLEARRWRLNNLCIPLTALVPACRTTMLVSRAQAAAIHAACGDQVLPPGYSPAFPLPPQSRDALRLAASGTDLRLLVSPPQALAYVGAWRARTLRGRRLVTITLRQSPFMPERNSNLAAWGAFARSLDPDNYLVAIVPDTDAALLPLPEELRGFEPFPAAAWSIGLRSALYESAWLNLGSSGGPFSLCWFNARARYLMFKVVVPGVPQATPEFLAERGYVIGAQPPFCGPGQEWVWEPDDLPVIERAFAKMAARLADQPRST